jgi:predicted acyl esterase
MMQRWLRPLLIALALLAAGFTPYAAPHAVLAQEQLRGEAFVRARYTKKEVYIPMRDGVKLFTSIYLPKDESKTYPILLQRTPYSCAPYGPEAYANNIGPRVHLCEAGCARALHVGRQI